jgi:hypothetical protein
MKGASQMKKDQIDSNETVKANIKMNEQLEDGKIHASTRGRTEAESANLEMQDRFRGENAQPAEGISSAFVYAPAIELNTENKD